LPNRDRTCGGARLDDAGRELPRDPAGVLVAPANDQDIVLSDDHGDRDRQCSSGLDVDELESSTAKIAVACWASEVQVTGSRRYAALVRLDITRRDPLRLVVASPLAQVPPGPDQLTI